MIVVKPWFYWLFSDDRFSDHGAIKRLLSSRPQGRFVREKKGGKDNPKYFTGPTVIDHSSLPRPTVVNIMHHTVPGNCDSKVDDRSNKRLPHGLETPEDTTQVDDTTHLTLLVPRTPMSSDPTLPAYSLPPGNMSQIAIGLVIQAFLNGGLVSLSATCILLLCTLARSNRDGSTGPGCTFWKWLIIVLLALNILYLTLFCVLFTQALHAIPETKSLAILLQLAPVLTVCLTDAVLVWRCYMVANALGPQRHQRFRRLLWILPLGVYITTVVSGTIGAMTIFTGAGEKYQPVLGAVALSSNAFLTIYATTFISICLLRYDRLLSRATMRGSAAPAEKGATEPRRITKLFQESAAINVPVALAAAVTVCNAQWTVGSMLISIAAPCQSLSTVLILHQVAIRKAIDQRRENDDTTPIGISTAEPMSPQTV
ncbi:hypothetical protein NP233_g2816 [Leucocoprinus birnbaumii]|uniref:Uncharacterized protein n=1 Tax=Leucocoprinus birnbaumii TaxID=56174 RepID=A0AAD5VY70_9AGAR|nr:hypothetical protein NP233_g2816 [Leucocoprinus birnbaumii]